MAFHSGNPQKLLGGCDHDVVGLKGAASLTKTWNGNSATVLNGMSGNFTGGAEYVVVNQSGNAATPSTLDADTRQCSNLMQAWADSIHVGSPGQQLLPQFIGPKGVGAMNDAGEYSVHSTGTAAVAMAPVSDAVCYFTRIAGKFRSWTDYVEIYSDQKGQNQRTWWLRAGNGVDGAPDGVWATARCLRLKQP